MMRDPCIGGAPQSNPMHRAQTCALTRSTLYGRGIDFAPRRAPATPGPDPFAPTGGLHGKNIHRKEPVAYLKRSIGIQDGATSARPLRWPVLYDDTGDVRKARHVRDEPHHRVKKISVHRQAPWSWKELMTAVDQIGSTDAGSISRSAHPRTRRAPCILRVTVFTARRRCVMPTGQSDGCLSTV